FDLGELMHTIQATGIAAGSAGFGAEAVGQADVAEREFGFVENLVHVQAAEGDLGGGDEAEGGVFDGGDLRFGATGDEADAFEDIDLGHVGRDDGGEAGLGKLAHRILDEGDLKQGCFVLEEVELRADDGGACLEVAEVEFFAKSDVV